MAKTVRQVTLGPGKAYRMASRFAAEGLWKDAIPLFESVVSRKPDDWGAYLQFGLALSEHGAYKKSVKSLQTASALVPRNPVPHLFLGKVHFDHQQYDKAVGAVQQALNIRPDYTLATAYLSLIRLSGGQIGEIISLQRLLPVTCNTAFEARLLAFCESQLTGKSGVNSLEESINQKRKHPQGDQVPREYPEAWRSRVYQWEARISHPLNPKRRKAAYQARVGDYLLSAGSPAAASVEYYNVLEVIPDSRNVRQQLVDALVASGDYEHAIEALSYFLKEEPDEPAPRIMTGILLCKLGHFSESLKMLDPTLIKRTRDFWVPYWRGVAHQRLGNRDKARRSFEKATASLNPRIAALRLNEFARISGVGHQD